VTYVWTGLIVLIVGGIGAAFLYGRRSGRDGIAADVAETTAAVQAKQDKAGAEAGNEDVVDRLRRGGF
jgi:hypothetical protein